MSAARETPAIAVEGLTKRFGSFTAVDAIDFDVRAGEIFGFLGPNGAGKSTTIRMLCGLIRPTAGGGRVAGLDIVREAELIKERIGYLCQRFSLYDDLTVRENIDFYAGVYRVPRRERAARRSWAVRESGLEGFEDRLTSRLARGWKQRLALACAILHRPPVLFLDEPTSGVDPVSRRRFWEVIRRLAGEGRTIFVTTHYMDEAEYCHRLALIFGGRIVAAGTPEELKGSWHGRRVVALEVDEPGRAQALLEGAAGVREAYVLGRGLRVILAGEGEDPAARLRREGVAVKGARDAAPTLEDVFVACMRGEAAG